MSLINEGLGIDLPAKGSLPGFLQIGELNTDNRLSSAFDMEFWLVNEFTNLTDWKARHGFFEFVGAGGGDFTEEASIGFGEQALMGTTVVVFDGAMVSV